MEDCNFSIKILEPPYPCNEILELIKDAFRERKEQGLNFVCLTYSLNDIENYLNNTDVVICIVDRRTDKLAAIQTVYFKQNSDEQYASGGLSAVASAYKRKGLGTMLFAKEKEVDLSRGCKFIIRDTSVYAKSSVNWHLKNGYKIVQLRSWSQTNYYSYIFRYQLVYHWFWSNSVLCKLYFLASSIKCRLCYYPNGNHTFLLKTYIKFHNLICRH